MVGIEKTASNYPFIGPAILIVPGFPERRGLFGRKFKNPAWQGGWLFEIIVSYGNGFQNSVVEMKKQIMLIDATEASMYVSDPFALCGSKKAIRPVCEHTSAAAGEEEI